ncbi:KxYKxGKxW signal peptide domain-containing protein [Weissella diestrammenae]|uniref:KxYKxGKxW signal peptide domain-containing protein n=1 Tax=Weissella diestrammenae TaxID=1162633 RepID=A0A7G9T431_9LACO|nr:KxYKxGKxW signal peptide domain-containing protein [Weissella diestrammenae]MCM0583378.1 KxYKxGKxW signal peptide domain-containing protein [Weissella diestrammenae]QNN74856.1 KxYKxGKxW signal peptide domain-containing protein [Weissella diestrammenae]
MGKNNQKKKDYQPRFKMYKDKKTWVKASDSGIISDISEMVTDHFDKRHVPEYVHKSDANWLKAGLVLISMFSAGVTGAAIMPTDASADTTAETEQTTSNGTTTATGTGVSGDNSATSQADNAVSAANAQVSAHPDTTYTTGTVSSDAYPSLATSAGDSTASQANDQGAITANATDPQTRPVDISGSFSGAIDPATDTTAQVVVTSPVSQTTSLADVTPSSDGTTATTAGGSTADLSFDSLAAVRAELSSAQSVASSAAAAKSTAISQAASATSAASSYAQVMAAQSAASQAALAALQAVTSQAIADANNVTFDTIPLIGTKTSAAGSGVFSGKTGYGSYQSESAAIASAASAANAGNYTAAASYAHKAASYADGTLIDDANLSALQSFAASVDVQSTAASSAASAYTAALASSSAASNAASVANSLANSAISVQSSATSAASAAAAAQQDIVNAISAVEANQEANKLITIDASGSFSHFNSGDLNSMATMFNSMAAVSGVSTSYATMMHAAASYATELATNNAEFQAVASLYKSGKPSAFIPALNLNLDDIQAQVNYIIALMQDTKTFSESTFLAPIVQNQDGTYVINLKLDPGLIASANLTAPLQKLITSLNEMQNEINVYSTTVIPQFVVSFMEVAYNAYNGTNDPLTATAIDLIARYTQQTVDAQIQSIAVSIATSYTNVANAITGTTESDLAIKNFLLTLGQGQQTLADQAATRYSAEYVGTTDASKFQTMVKNQGNLGIIGGILLNLITTQINTSANSIGSSIQSMMTTISKDNITFAQQLQTVFSQLRAQSNLSTTITATASFEATDPNLSTTASGSFTEENYSMAVTGISAMSGIVTTKVAYQNVTTTDLTILVNRVSGSATQSALAGSTLTAAQTVLADVNASQLDVNTAYANLVKAVDVAINLKTETIVPASDFNFQPVGILGTVIDSSGDLYYIISSAENNNIAKNGDSTAMAGLTGDGGLTTADPATATQLFHQVGWLSDGYSASGQYYLDSLGTAIPDTWSIDGATLQSDGSYTHTLYIVSSADSQSASIVTDMTDPLGAQNYGTMTGKSGTSMSTTTTDAQLARTGYTYTVKVGDKT